MNLQRRAGVQELLVAARACRPFVAFSASLGAGYKHCHSGDTQASQGSPMEHPRFSAPRVTLGIRSTTGSIRPYSEWP